MRSAGQRSRWDCLRSCWLGLLDIKNRRRRKHILFKKRWLLQIPFLSNEPDTEQIFFLNVNFNSSFIAYIFHITCWISW
jgi:hypothetical protein